MLRLFADPESQGEVQFPVEVRSEEEVCESGRGDSSLSVGYRCGSSPIVRESSEIALLGSKLVVYCLRRSR